MKTCLHCKQSLPLISFYPVRSKGGTLSYCRICHNLLCRERQKSSPKLRKTISLAKKRWTEGNPVAKRIHEKRSITLHLPNIPKEFHEAEHALMNLTSAIALKRRK